MTVRRKAHAPPGSPVAIALGKILAEARIAAEVSRQQLADRLDVHRNTVYRVETGEPLSADLFVKWCNELAIDAAETFKRMLESLNHKH